MIKEKSLFIIESFIADKAAEVVHYLCYCFDYDKHDHPHNQLTKDWSGSSFLQLKAAVADHPQVRKGQRKTSLLPWQRKALLLHEEKD